MQTFIFETPFEGRVDRDLGVIRGVSLITGGLTARGHELVVDDTTISQIFQSASSKGNVPVKLDHKSGVENVCGFVTSFRIEGNKLLGDWHLLRSHPHYETTMEKAERMPGCFGLSAAFVGKEEERDGKKFARCQELLAVDCVTQPAANPTGLFSRRVDTSTNVSPQPQLNTPMPPQAPIPPAADQNQELVALRQENAELNERLEGLNLGADDYLTKPFFVEELIARLHAVTRRATGAQQSILEVGDLAMNLLTREVTRAGAPIELAPREFNLLEHLMRSPGRVLTRVQICEQVWDYHFDPGTNLVEVYIQRLRKKVDAGAAVKLIETIRGVGYRIKPSS